MTLRPYPPAIAALVDEAHKALLHAQRHPSPEHMRAFLLPCAKLKALGYVVTWQREDKETIICAHNVKFKEATHAVRSDAGEGY
jgi:hypothetical protein